MDIHTRCVLKNLMKSLTVEASRKTTQGLLLESTTGEMALKVLEKVDAWQVFVPLTLLECSEGCTSETPTTWTYGWEGAQ
jgi:hypothetical protein